MSSSIICNNKFVNNNKQPQTKTLLNGVSAYNLLMVGPLAIKLSPLMYFGGEKNMLTTNSLRQYTHATFIWTLNEQLTHSSR